MRARLLFVALLAVVAWALTAAGSWAATPSSGTLTPDANNQGKLTFTGTMSAGTAAAGTTDDCFDADNKPDPTTGCDFFNLDVNVPGTFYDKLIGGVQVT